MFKKILIVTLVVLLLAGCAATGGATKLGLGHKVTFADRSADATADKAGTIISDALFAAAAVDANGKVVGIRIDDAQITASFDAAGKIVTDLTAEGKTKVELGDEYGMVKYGNAVQEWYKQVADLEKWMVGKTSDQIKGMKTKESESEGLVSDEADLNGKVTIGISDFLVVAQEAIANAK